jgi:hypothetical protein
MQFPDFEHRRDRFGNARQLPTALKHTQKVPDVTQDWYVGLSHAYAGYEMMAGNDLTGVKLRAWCAVYKAEMHDDGQQQRPLEIAGICRCRWHRSCPFYRWRH